MRRTTLIAAGAVLLTSGMELNAQASDFVITPTFDTAPAVLAAHSSGLPNPETVIFARKGSRMFVLGRQNGNTQWSLTGTDNIGTPLGMDGDPAIVYESVDPTPGTQIMLCVHGASSPGYMYCGAGRIDYSGAHIVYDGSQGNFLQVGSGTFNSGTSPSLIRFQDQSGNWIERIFARGQDQQIWYASKVDLGSWNGWSQMPTLTNGFAGDPAAAVLSGGQPIVCALRSSGTIKIVCNHQLSNGTWAGWSTAWDTGSLFTMIAKRPAMATASNATFLFSTAPADPSAHETVLFTTDGGVSWTAPMSAGTGYSFRSGPAAFASPILSTVTSMALGGDLAIWFNQGSSSGFNAGWTQIQAHYACSTMDSLPSNCP